MKCIVEDADIKNAAGIKQNKIFIFLLPCLRKTITIEDITIGQQWLT